jgi:hypothetical protein
MGDAEEGEHVIFALTFTLWSMFYYSTGLALSRQRRGLRELILIFIFSSGREKFNLKS